MRMCAHLEDVDLAPNFLGHFHVLDFALVEDLDCDFYAREDVVCHCVQL